VSATGVKFYYFLNNLYSSSQNGSQPDVFQAVGTLPINCCFHVKINNSGIPHTHKTDTNMRQRMGSKEGIVSAVN